MPHAEWFTPAEAARILGITPQRVRQLTAEGRLNFERTRLGRIIDPASVEAFRQEREARLAARGGAA